VHPIAGRALAAGAALLALAAPAAARADAAAPARPLSAPAALSPPARHVVLAGIGGLRWTDISPAATPVLWRLASQGSAGSLIVSGIHQRTCPADGWLTLNAAARAALPPTTPGRCPPLPTVAAHLSPARPGPAPALVPAMASLERYNARFSYSPRWGLLGTAAGPGRCATAAGPGAALALAGADGRVSAYLPSPSGLSAAILARCPLTVVDLGSLPAAPGPAGHAARTVALTAADRQLGRIAAALPAGTALIVAAPGDGTQPHLRAIVVRGPGFGAGQLAAPSTRQSGLVLLTDLTPTVLGWLGRPVPPAVTGSPLRSVPRAGLAAEASTLIGQDAAAQVYQQTVTPFYQLVGFGYPAVFALIAFIGWGRGARRRARRRAVARTAGLWAASVPAGTFLASLVPWWAVTHPALVLYSLAVAWAAVIATVAVAGPWRRDPLGPAGAVAAITLGVIGLDLVTGSHLALGTPFGLSVLEAGRFYGLGNNALVIYAGSGLLCAAWLGGAALRQGRRRQALLAMAAVAAVTVVVAGWPGFGAKVGGTIAMVPGFLVLLAVAAGVRITARRAALIAVSGVALVTLFALVNYFVPVTGHSDIGGFVGTAIHGDAGAIVRRKIGSNLRSLTANPFTPVIPVVIAALGAMIAWPARLRCTLLARGYRQIPLLRPALAAIWLVAVLGWFAEDSGVTVPAAALPLVLPLAVVILASLPPGDTTVTGSSRKHDESEPPPVRASGTARPAFGRPGYR
jgi:hypothetical protein